MRIYIRNMEPCKNGKLQGEWVTLPLDNFNKDLKAILKRIGKPKLYFISDYECEYYSVGKYADVEDLNRLAQHYDSLDRIDRLRLKYLVENYSNDIDEIIMCDLGYIDFYEDMCLEEVARILVKEGRFGEVSDSICFYIDFKKIAEDLSCCGYDQTDKGVFLYG